MRPSPPSYLFANAWIRQKKFELAFDRLGKPKPVSSSAAIVEIARFEKLEACLIVNFDEHGT